MKRTVWILPLVMLVAGCTSTGRVGGEARVEVATSGKTGSSGTPDRTFVCHGTKKPKWVEVADPAVEAHRKHGDRVSDRQQQKGAACQQ